MNSSTRLLSLEERRALLWVRANQPAVMSRLTPGAPTTKTRIALVQEGLIAFAPDRNRFDPPAYCVTAKGEEALRAGILPEPELSRSRHGAVSK
ncbi:hypothetical protein V1288_003724 [Bradyrhizobium sp. AZCC 2176]